MLIESFSHFDFAEPASRARKVVKIPPYKKPKLALSWRIPRFFFFQLPPETAENFAFFYMGIHSFLCIPEHRRFRYRVWKQLATQDMKFRLTLFGYEKDALLGLLSALRMGFVVVGVCVVIPPKFILMLPIHGFHKINASY